MKQTTMQELIVYLENNTFIDKKVLINKCKNLLEKEKQEIIDAYYEGDSNGAVRVYNRSMRDDISAEQYYNKTFKQK